MNYIKKFINKNFGCIVIACTLFLVGVIIGTVFAVRLSPQEADGLKTKLGTMTSAPALAGLSFGDILASGVASHLRLVGAMALGMLGKWLVPAAALIIAVNGYQLGFSVCFISGNFGTKGIVLSLISSLISYAFVLPVSVVLFCYVFRRVFFRGIRDIRYIWNMEAALVFVAAYSVLCVGSAVEGIILPLIIDLFF